MSKTSVKLIGISLRRPPRSWARRRSGTPSTRLYAKIVNAKRRLELIALLQDTDHYAFDSIEDAWGGND